MKPWRSLLLLSSLYAADIEAQAVVPGTYSFRVCDQPCTASSRDIATGILVLFADSTAFAESLKANAHALPNQVFERLPQRLMPNACFKVEKRERYVDGREYYFGITPRSTTRWIERNDSVLLPVYSSPDANHVLKWMRSRWPDSFTGIGIQGDCCSDLHGPFGAFVAIRRGPPDTLNCVG
jgi:hypothetical protein